MNLLITLEAARTNAGYKRKEAARLLGVHYDTLYKYERDSSKVSFSLIEQVEELYKVNRKYIFFGDKFEFIRTLRKQSNRVEV